jgi:hypothetical protein
LVIGDWESGAGALGEDRKTFGASPSLPAIRLGSPRRLKLRAPGEIPKRLKPGASRSNSNRKDFRRGFRPTVKTLSASYGPISPRKKLGKNKEKS